MTFIVLGTQLSLFFPTSNESSPPFPSYSVQSELDLPQIVVVGSQSVGKSSLIESMADVRVSYDSRSDLPDTWDALDNTSTRCWDVYQVRLLWNIRWNIKNVIYL
jgi:predicted ATPase